MTLVGVPGKSPEVVVHRGQKSSAQQMKQAEQRLALYIFPRLLLIFLQS